jgi:hypothetical protein
MFSTMTEFFRVEELPGHVSYLLIAISYLLTNIMWLRVVAVIGLFFEILYFRLSGGDLKTGIIWDIIFIAINIYQLYWLARERYLYSIPEPDRTFFKSSMPGLAQHQVQRLMSAGKMLTLVPGTVLVEEGGNLTNLFFICNGEARVSYAGRPIAIIGRSTFVGEAVFLTGGTPTATVVADTELRVLSFDNTKLRSMLAGDSEISHSFYEILGRDLAVKIRASNAAQSSVMSEAQLA